MFQQPRFLASTDEMICSRYLPVVHTCSKEDTELFLHTSSSRWQIRCSIDRIHGPQGQIRCLLGWICAPAARTCATACRCQAGCSGGRWRGAGGVRRGPQWRGSALLARPWRRLGSRWPVCGAARSGGSGGPWRGARRQAAWCGPPWREPDGRPAARRLGLWRWRSVSVTADRGPDGWLR